MSCCILLESWFSVFYRQCSWGPDQWQNLCKVPQPETGWDGIWTHVSWTLQSAIFAAVLPPSGSSPADSGIFPFFHSFMVHISKCSHSLLDTAVNTAANNGQGVLSLSQHCHKTAAPLSLAAPVFLHALPSRLASDSQWKCCVCMEATLFLLAPVRQVEMTGPSDQAGPRVQHVPT